jgi:hypothetical protein
MAVGLAFPFTFTRGHANVHDVESDAWAAQRIASVARTHVGELFLRPDFGTVDPEFFAFDKAGLMMNCGSYFGDIYVENVVERWNPDQSLSIEIPFKRV